MLDDNTDVVIDTDTTAETDTVSAPLEDVTSSTESEQTDTQVSTPEQGKPSEVDYLKVLDGLEVDPATKEALKAGYLRQQDYTRKTQEVAKDRGLIEEYRKSQPILEFLNKNPELFNEVMAKMQTPQPSNGQEEIPQDPREYAEWVKAQTIKEWQSIQAQEADFQSAAKVDPRLDSDPEFGETIARIVASDPEFRNHTLSAADATKKAIASFDKYISKAINSAKLSLSNKAKAKKSGSMVSSSPAKVGGGTQPMTIAEAAKMAEDELES
jgi:hypothetical protein